MLHSLSGGYTLQAMVDKPRVRKQALLIRLNDDEREMIETLAGAWGLSMSDALRQCIRREAKRALGVMPKSAFDNARAAKKGK